MAKFFPFHTFIPSTCFNICLNTALKYFGVEFKTRRKLCSHWKLFGHLTSKSTLKHVVSSKAKAYCAPMAVYGDKGRGVRRGNIACFALEAMPGLHSARNAKVGSSSFACTCCEVEEPTRKRFCNTLRQASPTTSCEYQDTRNKEHSFLGRFLLWLVPCSTYKAHPSVLDELLTVAARGLRELFYEGVEVAGRCRTVALIGSKGDMRRFERIAYLNRSYLNKGQVRNKAMCMECLAGLDNLS